MKLFAAVFIIVFLAFSGYHLTFRKFKLPLFAREFYLTGTEFLFLGLLLGPGFLNILDKTTMKELEPLTALLLGWIGLLCGFQFEISAIKKFPKAYLKSAVVETSMTFIIVFTGIYFVLPLYFDFSVTMRLLNSTMLAAAASCTAQTGLALLTSDILKKRADTVNFLRYISSIDSIAALIMFSFVFIFQYATMMKPTHFSLFFYQCIVVFVTNVGLVILYNLFLAQRRDIKELALVIIGMVTLTSGAASMLDFSPLLASFFIGTFLVNTTRDKERIFSLLISVEKPAYLLLLVFIGANWFINSVWYIAAAIIYVFIRFSGKVTGGFFASRLSAGHVAFPGTLGVALLEQGGIPLAILFDYHQCFPGYETSIIIAVAIIALIINDLVSPHLIDNLLGGNSMLNSEGQVEEK